MGFRLKFKHPLDFESENSVFFLPFRMVVGGVLVVVNCRDCRRGN